MTRSRQKTGQNLSAMIQAEEQALIADFHAVPKAERHRLREIGTEEAYWDWKMRLVTEPMEQAKEQVQMLWQQWQEAVKVIQEGCWNPEISQVEQERQKEREEALHRELIQAWDEWTWSCMRWAEQYFDD